MFMGFEIETLTASGLLALTVLMILFGALIPRRVYKDKAEEALRWQSAFELQRDRSDKLDSQTELLLEQGKATHALITAVFNNSNAIRQAGEQNVVS